MALAYRREGRASSSRTTSPDLSENFLLSSALFKATQDFYNSRVTPRRTSLSVTTKLVIIENSLVSSVKSSETQPVSAESFAPLKSSEGQSSNSSESLSSTVNSVNSVNSELLISNYINKKDFNSKLAAFIALRAVSRSISLDDIVSCRSSICKEQQGSSARTSDTSPLCTTAVIRHRQ